MLAHLGEDGGRALQRGSICPLYFVVRLTGVSLGSRSGLLLEGQMGPDRVGGSILYNISYFFYERYLMGAMRRT